MSPWKRNLPNILTAIRFVLTALFVVVLPDDGCLWRALLAFALFIVAAVTDFVDGYLARLYQVESTIGKLMDPLADKVLVAAGLIMLIPLGRVPAWVALVILCREFIVTGLRSLASASGLVVAAGGAGKLKAIVQYVALGILLFPPRLIPLPFSLHGLGRLVLYLALALTVWSGVDYFVRLRHLFMDQPGPAPRPDPGQDRG